MGVMFSERDARRISKTVRRVEKSPIVSHKPGVANRGSRHVWVMRGKLTTELPYKGSALMKVFKSDGSEEVETGRIVTVYEWMLGVDEKIEKKTKVVAALCGGRYYVVAAACQPDPDEEDEEE